MLRNSQDSSIQGHCWPIWGLLLGIASLLAVVACVGGDGVDPPATPAPVSAPSPVPASLLAAVPVLQTREIAPPAAAFQADPWSFTHLCRAAHFPQLHAGPSLLGVRAI